MSQRPKRVIHKPTSSSLFISSQETKEIHQAIKESLKSSRKEVPSSSAIHKSSLQHLCPHCLTQFSNSSFLQSHLLRPSKKCQRILDEELAMNQVIKLSQQDTNSYQSRSREADGFLPGPSNRSLFYSQDLPAPHSEFIKSINISLPASQSSSSTIPQAADAKVSQNVSSQSNPRCLEQLWTK